MASRLRVPVSLRVCALSRRTFMNNAGWQDAETKPAGCSGLFDKSGLYG
jgi:hypothetical protein